MCCVACNITILGRCLCVPCPSADRIKLIFWDGTGLCLFAKRLEEGIFL
ncbi:IS66 family insertion sequence element accessory protein TnpB [Bradyrhizobium diazoefficiens]